MSSEADVARAGPAPKPVSVEDRYERAACGLLSVDPQSRITSANLTFAQWGGFSAESLVGRTFTELLSTSSQLFFETRCQPILRLKGELREVALTVESTHRGSLAVLVNADVIRDELGGIVETRFAIFDSTQRQDYEQQLLDARRLAEASERRLRILQGAATQFSAAETADALAATLADTARDAFAATKAVVLLVRDGGDLHIAAGHDLESIVNVLLAADVHPETAAIAIGDLTVAAAIAPAVADALDDARFKGFSSIPLVDGTTLLGAMVLFYGRERAFDEASHELHEALARQAALMLARIRLQNELEQLALHDRLTGLANRNLLSERLAHAVAGSVRTKRPMALIFLDLDGFKPINDELGHRVGDEVLRTIAERLNVAIRQADIVGRYGGDEFLIICDDADADAARLVAERVLEAVRLRLPGLPVEQSLTASIGIAVFDPATSYPATNDALVRAADLAMYASKSAGGDRATVAEG